MGPRLDTVSTEDTNRKLTEPLGCAVSAILAFAVGCAAAAGLYAYVGFYGLAVPVLVGAATAFMRIED